MLPHLSLVSLSQSGFSSPYRFPKGQDRGGSSSQSNPKCLLRKTACCVYLQTHGKLQWASFCSAAPLGCPDCASCKEGRSFIHPLQVSKSKMLVLAVLLLDRIASHVNSNGMVCSKGRTNPQFFTLQDLLLKKFLLFVFLKVQDHGKFMVSLI